MSTPDAGHEAVHDLGGKPGFGAIDRSQDAVFANEWERRVFGMTLACGMLGHWNIDQSRYAREQMEPAEYLATGYYQHWLHGLELLLVEHGLLSRDELQGGKAGQGATGTAAVAAHQVAAILAAGGPTELTAASEPLFAVGARVRVRQMRPGSAPSHTRAPGYAQGHEGVVVTRHGAHVFPDRHAASGEKQARHLYSVRFAATELWGAARLEGEQTHGAVYIDLFEPYLQAASDAS